MGSAPTPRFGRALSEADPPRILAAQLLLSDRERRARGWLGRRATGRGGQYLRIDRLPAFRFELPRGVEPGAEEPEHYPRNRRDDPRRRRAPLRLRRGRFCQGRRGDEAPGQHADGAGIVSAAWIWPR